MPRVTWAQFAGLEHCKLRPHRRWCTLGGGAPTNAPTSSCRRGQRKTPCPRPRLRPQKGEGPAIRAGPSQKSTGFLPAPRTVQEAQARDAVGVSWVSTHSGPEGQEVTEIFFEAHPDPSSRVSFAASRTSWIRATVSPAYS